jgi:hypothetical protein
MDDLAASVATLDVASGSLHSRGEQSQHSAPTESLVMHLAQTAGTTVAFAAFNGTSGSLHGSPSLLDQ